MCEFVYLPLHEWWLRTKNRSTGDSGNHWNSDGGFWNLSVLSNFPGKHGDWSREHLSHRRMMRLTRHRENIGRIGSLRVFQLIRVSYNGSTWASQAWDVGSIPITRSTFKLTHKNSVILHFPLWKRANLLPKLTTLPLLFMAVRRVIVVTVWGRN